MRLFTHNFLQCHVRNCSQNNFPLQIQQDAEFEIKTAEYNADFLALQMCKIDYSALLQALKEVNYMLLSSISPTHLSFSPLLD